jgi:hypothetical protein
MSNLAHVGAFDWGGILTRVLNVTHYVINPDRGARATWARCSSGPGARSTIFGAESIKMALCSTSWFRNGASPCRKASAS